jgi:lipid II:glycine glycyltransferase (peptidoglycan interpeptide bridge formation enzyme)
MTDIHTNPDPALWDAFVARRNGSVLQAAAYGTLRAAFGWQEVRLALVEEGEIKAGALVVFRPLPAKVGTIAYVPRGPVVDWENAAHVAALLGAIKQAGKGQRAVYGAIEPDLRDTPANRALVTTHDLHEADAHMQPPRTIVVDLTAPLDDILMRMSQSTRRKVRLSDRKGVNIRHGGLGDIDSYTRMMETTGDRNDFDIYPPGYYRKALELFGERAALFMASYEEEDIAGLMAFRMGERAYYLYGASSNKERNRMPTYGLQWAAIQWAKAQGCTTYDMWGIPDEDEETLEAEFRERRDGLWGVYGFKRGFGGEVVRAVGLWETVYKPLVYQGLQVISTAQR